MNSLDLIKNFDGHHVMVTYFVRSGEAIKIGRTMKIRERIAALQTGSALPIELLKVVSLEESAAHAIAGTFVERLSGEWFQVSDRLLEWIKQLPDADLTAPVLTEEQIKKDDQAFESLKAIVLGSRTPEQAERTAMFQSMNRFMEGLIDRRISPDAAWECVKSVFANCFSSPQPSAALPLTNTQPEGISA